MKFLAKYYPIHTRLYLQRYSLAVLSRHAARLYLLLAEKELENA